LCPLSSIADQGGQRDSNPGTEALVGPQGFGVPARSLERNDEFVGERFPEGMVANQALEFADERRRQPSTQVTASLLRVR
jgi:hypothetical protein